MKEAKKKLQKEEKILMEEAAKHQKVKMEMCFGFDFGHWEPKCTSKWGPLLHFTSVL